MNKLVVRPSAKYGREAFYPANDAAKLFCDLLRSPASKPAQTLMPWQIEIIKKLGFEVETESVKL